MEKVKVCLLSRSFIIFLKGSFRKRSFSPLAHSPNDCVGQDWTRTKPGAGNPIQVSHTDGRGFPRHVTWLKVGTARTQLALTWSAGFEVAA